MKKMTAALLTASFMAIAAIPAFAAGTSGSGLGTSGSSSSPALSPSGAAGGISTPIGGMNGNLYSGPMGSPSTMIPSTAPATMPSPSYNNGTTTNGTAIPSNGSIPARDRRRCRRVSK